MKQVKREPNYNYPTYFLSRTGIAFRDDFVAFTQDSPAEISQITQPSRGGLFNSFGYITPSDDY